MKKIIALLLSVLLALNLAACGKRQDGDTAGGADTAGDPGLVYVPEFTELEDEGELYLYDVQFVGDTLCYRVFLQDGEENGAYVLRCRSLTDGTVTDLPMGSFTDSWTLGEDGSLYTVDTDYSEALGNVHADRFLTKLDRTGEQIFRQDITEFLAGEEGLYLKMAVDAKGRTYLLAEGGLLLFDEKGTPGGRVKLDLGEDLYSSSFGRGSDGKVYLTDSDSASGGSTTLYEVDYEAGKLGSGYADFPSVGGKLAMDAEGNYLGCDSNGVYRYSPGEQKKETVFKWGDSGIDVTTVSAVGGLSDGRIVVVCQDWASGKGGRLAFMTGVNAQDIPEGQKTELVLGCRSAGSVLQAAVAAFNKSSDSCQITIKAYMEGGTEWADAAARLNADIVSDNCPDIIELSLLQDWKNLTDKGAFEDLSPYLEQSAVLDREDIFDSVIREYTHEGELIAIPALMTLQTFVGSSEKLGDKIGWTIDDVIALSDAYPQAALIDGYGGVMLVNFCLQYAMDAYVDWEHGTCDFDNDEFKRLLEFVVRASDSQAGGVITGMVDFSSRERAQNGEILLSPADIYEYVWIQCFAYLYGEEMTAIGYPTKDGSPICNLSGFEAMAISSRCADKDAAWAFIESYLTREGRRDWTGFPTTKSGLEEMLAKELEYQTDSDGEPLLDVNGNYLPKRQMQIGEDFLSWYPTQQEIDMLYAMIDAAVLSDNANSQLLQIIDEEAAAFFQGQKTADQVADAIQRRASVYVSENS